MAGGLTACTTTITNPRTGQGLETIRARAALSGHPPVFVERFLMLSHATGGLASLSRSPSEGSIDHEVLDDRLVGELQRRGVSTTDRALEAAPRRQDAAMRVRGYITPRLEVQPPVGMQVLFSRVAIREFAVVVQVERPRAGALVLRTPVRVKDTRFVFARTFSNVAPAALEIAAGMIIDELARSTGTSG